MTAEAEFWLSRNLKEVFALPDAARDWLLGIWNLIQVFDDMADGAEPDRDRLDVAIYDGIVGLPSNPFFEQHKAFLVPLLSVAILKWKAADDVERAGKPSATAFVWRAGYYDIVLAVVHLVHGFDSAMQISASVMQLYGESYADYLAEWEGSHA